MSSVSDGGHENDYHAIRYLSLLATAAPMGVSEENQGLFPALRTYSWDRLCDYDVSLQPEAHHSSSYSLSKPFL